MHNTSTIGITELPPILAFGWSNREASYDVFVLVGESTLHLRADAEGFIFDTQPSRKDMSLRRNVRSSLVRFFRDFEGMNVRLWYPQCNLRRYLYFASGWRQDRKTLDLTWGGRFDCFE